MVTEIIATIAVFLCLSIGIILFVILYQRRVLNHQIHLKELDRQKQEELMQASIRSEEEERMRIAAELHDDVGATLSSIRLMLYNAARNPGDVSSINQCTELIDESIQKVRNLSHQLQPGTLQYLGLMKSLQSLAEMLSRTGQVTVSCATDTEAWPSLDPPRELGLYRIVQEVLNNIIKHSGAAAIDIHADVQENNARILIAHNGQGLSENSYQELLYKQGAIGLKNIEMRLKAIGASISFPSTAAGIFTTVISMPVNTAVS